jgi:hypothetical protein
MISNRTFFFVESDDEMKKEILARLKKEKFVQLFQIKIEQFVRN